MFSIGLQTNCQAGGSFGLAPRLVSDLRGAMVHVIFQNLFRARAGYCSVLGFGNVLLTSQSKRARFVRRKLVFNRPPLQKLLNVIQILRLSIFGRPAVGFFFKTAVKASVAPLRITTRCESFCSCEFKICAECHTDFAFVHFWPPC